MMYVSGKPEELKKQEDEIMSEQKKTSGGKWDYRQWSIVCRLLVIPGLVLMVGRLFTGFTQLVAPGLVMTVAGMALAAIKLNCPHCGGLVADLLTRNVNKCPHCEKALEPVFGKKKTEK